MRAKLPYSGAKCPAIAENWPHFLGPVDLDTPKLPADPLKTLALLVLTLIALFGPVYAAYQFGPAAALAWFAQPLHLAALVAPLALWRFERELGGGFKKVLRHHKANLAGPVPILVGTNALPGSDDAPRLKRRSRTWTILGVWVAALFVVASYLITGGHLIPTAALATIAGLYWLCPTWRLYLALAALAVFACAATMLLQGAPLGMMPLFYASLTLAIVRSRRSLGVALSVALACEAFRFGVGSETVIALSVLSVFQRHVGVALDQIWANLLAHIPRAELPSPQEPWGLHGDAQQSN